MMPGGAQHLLIDADDTLWENNIYFEDAFEEFVDYLKHSSMSAPEIRVVLDEIEVANIKIHATVLPISRVIWRNATRD